MLRQTFQFGAVSLKKKSITLRCRLNLADIVNHQFCFFLPKCKNWCSRSVKSRVFLFPGVDKAVTSMGDARDAMINAAVDMLGAYGTTLTNSQRLGQVPCPFTLRLMPLGVLALLKSVRMNFCNILVNV